MPYVKTKSGQRVDMRGRVVRMEPAEWEQGKEARVIAVHQNKAEPDVEIYRGGSDVCYQIEQLLMERLLTAGDHDTIDPFE